MAALKLLVATTTLSLMAGVLLTKLYKDPEKSPRVVATRFYIERNTGVLEQYQILGKHLQTYYQSLAAGLSQCS
jgi:hypothetical protein